MKTSAQRTQSIRPHGFTLVEISIVLVIVGAIFYGVLKSQAIISSSKAKDVISKINDIRTATAYFKQRYGYLPGDLPNPALYITANPALVQGSGGNIGDGSLDGAVSVAGVANAGTEVAQAPWQLFNAGFIGAISAGTPTYYLNTTYGPIQIVSAATANLLVTTYVAQNPASRNAILFFNLPCDVALEVDTKIDDGTLNGGYGVGSTAVCPTGSNLPVYAVPL